MKTFRQYMENADLGISGASPDESLVRIARLASKNHREALMDFFHGLATKDRGIRHELDNINRNNANKPLRGKPQPFQDDKDEVVPTPPDSSSGPEES